MSTWHTLLDTAIHAPSPHNVQPWRVRIVDDAAAELLIDVARTLPKEDVTGSFIILTMGMFIEALDIVAGHHRGTVAYELCEEPQWYANAIQSAVDSNRAGLLPFARLRLEPCLGSVPRYDESLFRARRTSRITLKPEPVPTEIENALARLASEHDQRYEQVTDPGQIGRLLERNIDAVFEDLNQAGYHDEIAAWFRFTDRAARRTRDGLDYRCMNSSRISFWLAAQLPQLLKLRLTRPHLWALYRKQLGLVPTIGMLAGEFWDPARAFVAGRFLMRFWLETALHGLYIHPYGNLVTNAAAAEFTRRETGIPGIWLIFKIGYSMQPPKSYRRPAEEVIVG